MQEKEVVRERPPKRQSTDSLCQNSFCGDALYYVERRPQTTPPCRGFHRFRTEAAPLRCFCRLTSHLFTLVSTTRSRLRRHRSSHCLRTAGPSSRIRASPGHIERASDPQNDRIVPSAPLMDHHIPHASDIQVIPPLNEIRVRSTISEEP